MIGNPMMLIILLPLAAWLIAIIIPRRLGGAVKSLTMLVAIATLVMAIYLWLNRPMDMPLQAPQRCPLSAWNGKIVLHLDALSGLGILATGLFGVIVTLYSLGFLGADVPAKHFYSNILLVLACSYGILLSADFVLLCIFWGLMAIPFFILINLGREGSDYAAKKTFIVTGGADSVLVLGIALFWLKTSSTSMIGEPLATTSAAAIVAFLCLTAAAFAKAGGMPLHSWIPDVAETAPTPVTALLPASLDKIVGIYLLARISLHVFAVSGFLPYLIMLLGAVTIVAAVMMALVQHDLKKLLGFHAVSQVGYMILGIGTGVPLGVAGGIFHMLNNAIYKLCLFLTAGAAERKAGTAELEKMGGLYKYLPAAFVSCVVASLAISGVPPLNGFVSKWMVYQGIIETGKGGGWFWILMLVAAMFGSALTLASFVKVIHSVFLGQPHREASGEESARGPDSNLAMNLPMLILAALCVIFGIWAFSIPLRLFIYDIVPGSKEQSSGLWQPGLATGLIVLSLIVGLLIYLYSKALKVRVDEPYVGGQDVLPDWRVSGTGFYLTISELPVLSSLYRAARKRLYDFYEISKGVTFYFTAALRALHSGVLLTYLLWCVVGLLGLLWLCSVYGK